MIKTDDSPDVKLVICGELLEPAVAEKTDPIAGITVRPGERRPRRPSGALAVSLAAGYQKISISDKRGTRIESKLDGLFAKAEGWRLRSTPETSGSRKCGGRRRFSKGANTNCGVGSSGWTGT